MSDYEPLFSPIPDDAMSCWDHVEQFIAFWHSPLTADHGNTLAECATAEERLGGQLPAFLRHWYCRAGRRLGLFSSEQSKSMFKMLPLDQLEFVTRNVKGNDADSRSFLVIRRADASAGPFAMFAPPPYAIDRDDLHADDPPVWQLWKQGALVTTMKLSTFAAVSIFYDTLSIAEIKEQPRDETLCLPDDARQIENYPENFGLIETAAYEGKNWIGIVSGTGYFRIRVSGEEDLLCRTGESLDVTRRMSRARFVRLVLLGI